MLVTWLVSMLLVVAAIVLSSPALLSFAVEYLGIFSTDTSCCALTELAGARLFTLGSACAGGSTIGSGVTAGCTSGSWKLILVSPPVVVAGACIGVVSVRFVVVSAKIVASCCNAAC